MTYNFREALENLVASAVYQGECKARNDKQSEKREKAITQAQFDLIMGEIENLTLETGLALLPGDDSEYIEKFGLLYRPLAVGQQITYIPGHAEGDPNHPDCEHGFVMADLGSHVRCRYFWGNHPTQLRTLANSEQTFKSNLVPCVRPQPQVRVDTLVKEILQGNQAAPE